MLMPVTIAEVLAQFAANCPQLAGAVVSTHDGLVLASTDSFDGDTSAACAASLWVHLQADLAMLQTTGLSESLIWAPPGVWYLARLTNDHLLLAHSQATGHAGALRLAGQIATQQLSRMVG